jgi:hypothetical protein
LKTGAERRDQKYVSIGVNGRDQVYVFELKRRHHR